MKTLNEKCEMFMLLSKTNMYLVKDIDKYLPIILYNIPHFMTDNIKASINEVFNLRQTSNQKKPLYYKSPTHLCFLAVNHLKSDSTIVIGPFTDGSINSDKIKYIGYQMKLTNENVEILNNFINTIPIFNEDGVLNLASIFKSMLDTDIKSVDLTSVSNEFIPSDRNKFSSKFNQYDFVKENFEVEEKMLKIVELGDVDALKKISTSKFNIPVRNPLDPLREAKNLGLTLNSICMRAAVKGGLSPHLAHSMSHKYAILIEKQVNTNTTSLILSDILTEYTSAVNKYSLEGYSTLIKESIIFIRRHITEAISLKDIAQNLNISGEHLSRQFKKETKVTISYYIQRMKVEESLELINSKEYSLSNIAYLFGFSNPAHYSTTFKKIMGISPANYQNKNKNN